MCISGKTVRIGNVRLCGVLGFVWRRREIQFTERQTRDDGEL